MKSAAILHLSDIHRTNEEKVGNAELLRWLVADLDRHKKEGIPQPDVVVVSGDITQTADTAEYVEACQLLRDLIAHLGLKRDRLVVVPGNHDVHWPTCEDNVRVRLHPRSEPERMLARNVGGRVYTYESEDSFQQRLKNFRDFYRNLFDEDFPTAMSEAFVIKSIDHLDLAFVGLSSVDRIDHEYFRPSFSPDAIHGACKALTKRQRVIAVWHHDHDWQRGASDCLAAEELRLLSTGPFLLGLCGHTHRPAKNDVCAIEGYPFPIIAAGSLCAGPLQRPESRGRSYNIIRIDDDVARVWVRTKDERGSAWKDLSVFGEATSRRSWFEIRLASNELATEGTQTTSERTSPRRSRELRAANPFSDRNAKHATRTRNLIEYVWTRVADDAATNLPQIVVGTRGSGKTALLLTMTLEAQLEKRPNVEHHDIVGLYCPMKINEITSFNGKGALSIDDRKALFRAMLATMWAIELLDAVESFRRWCEAQGTSIHEGNTLANIARAWGIDLGDGSIHALRNGVRDRRDQVLQCLSATLTAQYSELISSIRKVPLLRGGLGPLEDAARELRHWAAFAETRWIALFDEVEFLNVWQQECLYEYMSNTSPSTTCKIATLPYAHSRALADYPSVLVLGDDYAELSVLWNEETEFERVAKGLWVSRVGSITKLSLEEAWPSHDYADVLRENLPGLAENLNLDDELIQDLPEERREVARSLQAEDAKKFSDQFRRKYQVPFRYRFARKSMRNHSRQLPLVYGWKQMLRACGTNPRQFLMLAEICWTKYWHKGVRPLSAAEQYAALKIWSDNFNNRCAALPHKGQELDSIVRRIAGKLATKLYSTKTLQYEQLSVQIEDCTQDQAEAIAIGIAYGFLVPRLSEDASSGRPMFPPADIVMRLGYPVAAHHSLPLRQGEVLKLKSMRQLELSWWNE